MSTSTNTKKYYWRHDESCSCGVVATQAELFDMLDLDGHVDETDEATYNELIENGYDT